MIEGVKNVQVRQSQGFKHQGESTMQHGLRAIFFFSSRRRHTRFDCDWSSDVCSSDLHVFCTRLSWVAADAVVQRAMRHSSPETKRHYQLGMVDQVREGIEQANERTYQNQKVLRFYYGGPKSEKEAVQKSVTS